MDQNSTLESLIFEATESERLSGYDSALGILEKAHLLSQPHVWPHFYIHWLMFKLALRNKVYKEVMGQIPRLILAMPGSWLGKAPRGNVGTTRMGIFEEK